jgi:phage shock protein A
MALYDPTQPGQNALENLRAATASVSTAQKIAQRDYAQAQAETDKWSRRYKLALKEGRKDLAPQAKFQKYYAQVKNKAEEWHKKAHMALENNDDNLAIQAILNKTVQSQIAIALKTQLQQQEATVTLLKRNLTTLESLKETTTISNSSTVVDCELESLRKQLEQM